MAPSLRSTRRTTSSQPMSNTGKENLDTPTETIHPPRGDAQGTPPSKRARHRLSTFQLTRLEDMFKRETHPNRQQKKDLAVELGMDYKTITIWFQNKRQTSKRSQLPTPDRQSMGARSLPGRTTTDSCLRSVSSPSHNTTLGTASSSSGIDSPVKRLQSKSPVGGLSVVASKAMKIVNMRPLLDSLNILASKPRELVESSKGNGNDNGEAANHKDGDDTQPLMASEDATPPPEIPAKEENEEMAVQEPSKEKSGKWKRLRTLEWACERQTKRRKLTKEGYTRLGSEEVPDSDRNDLRTESALSLLSLASPTRTHVRPPKDVVMGAALLISLKNSWSRK